MAGSIFWQELISSSIYTISSNIIGLAANSSASLGTIDGRSGGTTGLVEKLVARAELISTWNVTTGIAFGTPVFDFFLVPSIDGTNFPDVDAGTTPGAGTGIGPNYYVGTFTANKAPAASTATRFLSGEIDFYPRLYTVYITNRSGQTNVTSQVRIVADQMQYT